MWLNIKNKHVRASLFAFYFFASAAVYSAAAVPLYTDLNMPAAVMTQLMQSQDMALNLKYDEAEQQLRAARALLPEHPLGGVFLLATRLSQLQDSIRQGQTKVPVGFYTEVNELIALAQAQAQAYLEKCLPKILFRGSLWL